MMESLFFNITDTKYKITELFKEDKGYITRVDISNGIVFLEGKLVDKKREISFKNLDRMVIIIMVDKGSLSIKNHINKKQEYLNKGEIAIYCSTKQNMTLTMQKSKKTDIFILFIADFFLKRYVSGDKNEPIDFLYHKIQKDISLEKIDLFPVDALSLYIVKKLVTVPKNRRMQSLYAEHHVMEFMLHCFRLIDIYIEDISNDDLKLAAKAKAILLKDFVSPPTIQKLAHLCATNESKLKKAFKKVYQSTLYAYVQKLRLEEANLLLKEENLTIGQIAIKVGYRHQGYFSKLFFSTYGIYPKALRRH